VLQATTLGVVFKDAIYFTGLYPGLGERSLDEGSLLTHQFDIEHSKSVLYQFQPPAASGPGDCNYVEARRYATGMSPFGVRIGGAPYVVLFVIVDSFPGSSGAKPETSLYLDKHERRVVERDQVHFGPRGTKIPSQNQVATTSKIARRYLLAAFSERHALAPGKFLIQPIQEIAEVNIWSPEEFQH
jgi:hypothetical protein